MRAAKARAAGRGEALKALFTRAVSRELGRSDRAGADGRAEWPLVRSARKARVRLTNDDLARIDAADDAGGAAGTRRRRR